MTPARDMPIRLYLKNAAALAIEINVAKESLPFGDNLDAAGFDNPHYIVQRMFWNI